MQNYWIGLENIRLMFQDKQMLMSIELANSESFTTDYIHGIFEFKMKDEINRYKATFGQRINGNFPTRSLLRHDGSDFSLNTRCTGYYKSGWWFNY